MDRRPDEVVRRAARHDRLHGAVPRPPNRDHALAGSVERGAGRGPAGRRALYPGQQPACRRRGQLPAGGRPPAGGDFDAAEAAYREASQRGREPQPGLALLRLACGDTGAAVGTIRRVLAESGERPGRAALLPAVAEVMLSAGEVDEAGERLRRARGDRRRVRQRDAGRRCRAGPRCGVAAEGGGRAALAAAARVPSLATARCAV